MSRFPLLDAEISRVRALPEVQLSAVARVLMEASGKNPVTFESVRRLVRLAEYLSELPANYKQFDMAEYLCPVQDYPYPRKRAPYEGGPIPCGTVACALGHAPVALGNKVPTRRVTGSYTVPSWEWYSELTFGCLETASWQWMFGTHWSDTDNTPHGAAARIMHLIGCIADNLEDPNLYVNMDDMFMAREHDAYEQLLNLVNLEGPGC